MAIINILPNGSTSGNPNLMGNKNPVKRKSTIGWNYQVSARLRKWLYSIPTESLNGNGLAFTLTIRDCPGSSDEWSVIRDNFLKRIFRDGCIRVQWLTEWQARGVPHLHGIAYFDGDYESRKLIKHWCDLASKKYGAASWAQDCKPVTNVLGWLDYLSKHASRSASHYQRSPENIPEGWINTGRMWGYRGDWDIRTPMKFEVDQQAFYKYRRIAKGIYHSKVRARLNQAVQQPADSAISMTMAQIRQNERSTFKQYQQSKSSLKSSDINMGRMMGTSDWINQETTIAIITWLGSQGHKVVQA